MELHDKVTYNSHGRPWLRGRVGVVRSFNTLGTSALVTFPASGGYNEASEWIGTNVLEPVKSDISDTRQKVLDEIKTLEKVISEARSKISKLNTANKTLKDLGL